MVLPLLWFVAVGWTRVGLLYSCDFRPAPGQPSPAISVPCNSCSSHTPRILLGLQELLDKTGQNSGNSGDLQMKQITFPYSQPDTDSDHISSTPLKPYAICNLH